jgi:hypothetical protein
MPRKVVWTNAQDSQITRLWVERERARRTTKESRKDLHISHSFTCLLGNSWYPFSIQTLVGYRIW